MRVRLRVSRCPSVHPSSGTLAVSAGPSFLCSLLIPLCSVLLSSAHGFWRAGFCTDQSAFAAAEWRRLCGELEHLWSARRSATSHRWRGGRFELAPRAIVSACEELVVFGAGDSARGQHQFRPGVSAESRGQAYGQDLRSHRSWQTTYHIRVPGDGALCIFASARLSDALVCFYLLRCPYIQGY